MDKQVRNAKAVVGIDEVHFLKHTCGEPKITQNLLDGKKEDGTTALDPGWFSVTTVKGTVEVSQDPLSQTKINIDQSNMPIGISTEPGDFNVNFAMPDLRENLKNWLEGDYEDPDFTPLKIGNAEGYGYDFNVELLEMTMAIKTKSGEWLIFPSIQGSVGLQMADDNFRLQFNGSVLGASHEDNRDVYVLSGKGCSSSSDVVSGTVSDN